MRQLDDVLAQSPDGRRLAVGAGVEAVLIDRVTLEPQAYLPGQGWISGLAFSPDGRRVAASGDRLAVWDVSGPEPSEILHQDSPTDMPQLQPGRADRLHHPPATSSRPGTCRGRGGSSLAEPGEPLDVETLRSSGSRPTDAGSATWRRTPRGSASGTSPPARSSEEVVAPGMEQGRFIDLAWHPDGTLLNITSGAPEVRTWDAVTGREVARHRLGPPGSTEGASIAFFSVDGKYLLVGTTTGRLHVLDAHTLAPGPGPDPGEPRRTASRSRGPSAPSAPAGTATRPTSATVVVDYLDGTVRTSRISATPIPRWFRRLTDAGSWSTPETPASACSTPRPCGGSRGPTPPRPGSWAYLTAFSPDGSLFASTSDGDSLSYWDARTGRLLGSVAVDVGGAPAFSADNSSLLLAGDDGSVLTWNLDPRSWMATACRLAGRELTEQEWRSYLGDRPYERVCGG